MVVHAVHDRVGLWQDPRPDSAYLTERSMEATLKNKGHDSPAPVLCSDCGRSLKTDFERSWCPDKECAEAQAANV